MAVVLSAEDPSYFSSSTLRRSQSLPKFIAKHNSFHVSASASRLNDLYHQHPSDSLDLEPPSPAPSTPISPEPVRNESSDLSSCLSTPASTLSLASDCDDDDDDDDHVGSAITSEDDHIVLSGHDHADYFRAGVEDLGPPPSPTSGHSYTASPYDQDSRDGSTSSTTTSRPESPGMSERAEDDIAIKVQPSRHVDYLSHNWSEEDIWSSWKHVVSKRGDYSNAARLENASWRTWMKAKFELRTVSPETLNWLKDYDVTWLYGPLQTGPASLNPIHTEMNSGRLSKSNSFIRKPILKKRSMSEVMLQRSLSTSSLIKQAAASVQAQQKQGRPGLERAHTDYVTFRFASRRISNESTGSLLLSAASSGIMSPSGERKHIHFNEQVAQCIAVDVKGEDDDEYDERDVAYPFAAAEGSDSDEGAVMMKRSRTRRRRPASAMKKAKKSAPPSGESKTIAMLPSTTLKYREDTPDPVESALKHSKAPVASPAHLSPSSSQETLKPSGRSTRLFLGSDEDEDQDGEEEAVKGGGGEGEALAAAGRRSPTGKFHEGPPPAGLHRSASTSSLTAEPEGMRRTASGMFMPVEEGTAPSSTSSEGLFGRVVDTVNTARDMVHIILNVGWRR